MTDVGGKRNIQRGINTNVGERKETGKGRKREGDVTENQDASRKGLQTVILNLKVRVAAALKMTVRIDD